MAFLPRGIEPGLLVSQVKNTMPYLFAESIGALGTFPPAQVLRGFDASHAAGEKTLTHFEYFRLCVSSHFLTCGTPVPTDVDNQIRRKLWADELPVSDAVAMAALVLESRSWDFKLVSSRFTYGVGDWASQTVSGHLGEWFTLSSAAYCALAKYAEPEAKQKRAELFDAIRDEVHRHSEIFGTLWRAKEGLSCLKASACIAHNFGDLDRVMEMWELSVGDPLSLEFSGLTRTPFGPNGKLRYLGRLWTAGELYKSPIAGSAMALENHRHFALRKPRCLRQSPDFLIPIGPFFDDWGKKLAMGLASEGKASEQTLEVIAALEHGWDRLPKTVGYGRALRGILEVHPELTARGAKRPQAQFEKDWNDEALVLLDDIPSRA